MAVCSQSFSQLVTSNVPWLRNCSSRCNDVRSVTNWAADEVWRWYRYMVWHHSNWCSVYRPTRPAWSSNSGHHRQQHQLSDSTITITGPLFDKSTECQRAVTVFIRRHSAVLHAGQSGADRLDHPSRQHPEYRRSTATHVADGIVSPRTRSLRIVENAYNINHLFTEVLNSGD